MTGKGIRIGVIDSGVHPHHSHIAAEKVIGAAAVARDGSVSEDAADALDRLGHGTAVTAAIQEKAPDAELLIVRVFHNKLAASAAALVAAIDYCVGQGVDLINLSLGSTNDAHRLVFQAAAERALARNTLLVAARAVGDVPCFPGALPMVLGVGLDWDCPRDRFAVQDVPDGVAYIASGYPRPIDGAPLHRNLHGISFAVAQMTGFAARACQAVRETGVTGDRDRLVRRQLEAWAAVPVA